MSESTLRTIYNRIFYAKAVIDNKLLEKELEASSRAAASSTIGNHLLALTSRNRYSKMRKSSENILKNASNKLGSLAAGMESFAAELLLKNINKESIESYVESLVKLELNKIFQSIGIKNNNIDELELSGMKEDDIVAKEEVIVDDKKLGELNEILQILAKYSKDNLINFKHNSDGTYSLIIKYYFKYSFTYKSSNKFLHDIKSYIDNLLKICYNCTNEIIKILNEIISIKIGNENNKLYDKYYSLFKELIKCYLRENSRDKNNEHALDEIKALENKNIGGKYSKTKKPSVKKAPAKKAPVKKAPAKKAPSKKAPAKKAPAKKAPAKKAPAKKAPSKKAPAKKAPVKKAPAKKAPAKVNNNSIISYM
jgi:hypothetical protein